MTGIPMLERKIRVSKRKVPPDMACKGICYRFAERRPVKEGRYATGQKRCNTCCIFVKTEGFRCPCCGKKLRTKPGNKRLKDKLMLKSMDSPMVSIS